MSPNFRYCLLTKFYSPNLIILILLIIVHLCCAFPIRDSPCDNLRGDGCNCTEISDQWSCCCSGRSIKSVPQNLEKNVTKLIMRRIGIDHIRSNDFQNYSALTQLEIVQAYNLALIEADAFTRLGRLKKLSIRDCPKLDRIDGYLVDQNRELLTLEVKRTSINRIPKIRMLTNGLSPPAIDFAENEIASIESGEVDNVLVSLLRLSHNRISYIADHAFKESKIFVLRLDYNPLTEISPNAFAGISALTKLDLSSTKIQSLPEEGLGQVEILDVQDTPSLKKLPPLVVFMNLKEAKLHYHFHCCLFKYAPVSTPNLKNYAKKYEGNLQELREKYCNGNFSTTPLPTLKTRPPSTATTPGDLNRKGRKDTKSRYKQPDVKIQSDNKRPNNWDRFGQFGSFVETEEADQEDLSITRGQLLTATSYARSASSGIFWGSVIPEEPSHQRQSGVSRHDAIDSSGWHQNSVSISKVVVPCLDGDRAVNDYFANVQCTPQPDALNPCEDVMIGWHLRILIFFVWIAAIVGNVLVIIVLCVTTQPRQKVNNFLMLNLAFADLCTGVYLAMLALIDVTTSGKYYNYAVAWQTGWGCKIAGTLSVFASELSIVTMVMISFEVWYNTKYALFQKRLPLQIVFPVMLTGWIMAGAAAALPLAGVNDYSATSTCLPLRLNNATDRVYLIACLSLNVLGFGYIVFNYVSVYCTVARSEAATAHAQDVALAKLMFCLIFTDFLCWAPMVLFGLTAAARVPLISISVAKVFLVLFYPLNAFANPWIYVFLTKRFRKNVSRYIRKHIWLHDFLSNILRHHHSTHPDLNGNSSNNYFYQSQPHNPTQTTNLTRGPSTCSSVLVTPRGSASLPHTSGSTSRSSSSGSCNEVLTATESSTLLVPLGSIPTNGTSAVSGVNGVGFVGRRRSTTPKFRPNMSDIIENSNSNSTEDDQKHLSPKIGRPPKQYLSETNGPLLSDFPFIPNLVGRRRESRRSEDARVAQDASIELRHFSGSRGSESKTAPTSDPSDNTADLSRISDNQQAQNTDYFGGSSIESGYCSTATSV